jgi:hypothetical protein
MLTTVDAALRELEEEPDAPEGETSLQLLQAIYRDKRQPLNVRVRCAIESLQHEYGKVAAVPSQLNREGFAEALDRAIKRSEAPLPLPAPKTIEHDADELKGPMARLERRF